VLHGLSVDIGTLMASIELIAKSRVLIFQHHYSSDAFWVFDVSSVRKHVL
jgi:hypothetical protein